MKIKDLPLNDEYAQYISSLNLPEENALIKKTNMLNCQHLFVKIKEKDNSLDSSLIDQNYNSIEVECVHCGLTNKFRQLEDFFRIKQMALDPYRDKTLESKIFESLFKKVNLEDESLITLISNDVLETYHPGLLYRLALTLNPNANLDELFAIMNALNSLETSQERLRLKKDEQATDLLKRYKRVKPKILTKTKKM